MTNINDPATVKFINELDEIVSSYLDNANKTEPPTRSTALRKPMSPSVSHMNRLTNLRRNVLVEGDRIASVQRGEVVAPDKAPLSLPGGSDGEQHITELESQIPPSIARRLNRHASEGRPIKRWMLQVELANSGRHILESATVAALAVVTSMVEPTVVKASGRGLMAGFEALVESTITYLAPVATMAAATTATALAAWSVKDVVSAAMNGAIGRRRTETLAARRELIAADRTRMAELQTVNRSLRQLELVDREIVAEIGEQAARDHIAWASGKLVGAASARARARAETIGAPPIDPKARQLYSEIVAEAETIRVESRVADNVFPIDDLVHDLRDEYVRDFQPQLFRAQSPRENTKATLERSTDVVALKPRDIPDFPRFELDM